jgi:hypothetical protein
MQFGSGTAEAVLNMHPQTQRCPGVDELGLDERVT